MPTLQEVRAQYPQYNDMSDADLAKALHGKYYSDMPYDEFVGKIGLDMPASDGNAAPWNMMSSAMDMLTMGGQSKLNAAGKGLIEGTASVLRGQPWNFSDVYNRELAEERGSQAQFAERHPIQNRVGQGVGLGVGIARLPAATVFRGSGLAPRMGNAAITGGIYGTAGGLIQDADSIGERATNTLVGGGLGSLIGGAAPAVAAGLGKGWQLVAKAMENRGIQAPEAIRKILTQLQGSGMTPRQAMQRINELGPEGMLADVNPGMQAATGATASMEPGAASLVAQRLGNRMQGAQQRISQDLDATIGPPRDPYTQMQANRGQRGTAGSQYEGPLTNAPVLPEGLRDTLAAQLTNPASGLAKRNFMMGIMNQIDDALSADTPELVARRLHSIRKDLDAQIVRDPRAAFMLSSADKANQGALKEARDAIDDVLKNRIPGFAEADEAFAPIARQQEAYEGGRQALRDKVSVGEHRANVAGYSRGERQYSNAGMRYDIEQRLDRPRQNAGLTADRILGSNAAQQKLEASIGRPSAERLRRGIGREETFTETSNLADVRRNSRTAPLTHVAQEMWGSGRGWLGDALASGAGGLVGGGPTGAAGAVVGSLSRSLSGGTRKALSRGATQTIRQVADRLTSTGAQRTLLMRQMEIMASRLPRNAQTAQNIETIASHVLRGSANLLAPSLAQRGLGLLNQ